MTNLSGIQIAIVVIISMLILISIIANGIVCLAFVFSKDLRTTSNYFIISLVVNDVMMAIVAMPSYVIGELVPSKIKLEVTNGFDILFGTVSIANLIVMSLNQAIAIWYPIRHKVWMTNRKTFTLLMSAWLYALLIASSFWYKYQFSRNSYNVFLVTASAGVAIAVIFFTYILILIRVKSRMRSRDSSRVSNAKTAIMVFVIFLIFLICWAPFYTRILLETYYCDKDICPFRKVFDQVSKILIYCTSGIHPLIYAAFDMKLRKAMRDIIARGSCEEEERSSAVDQDSERHGHSNDRNRSNSEGRQYEVGVSEQ